MKTSFLFYAIGGAEYHNGNGYPLYYTSNDGPAYMTLCMGQKERAGGTRTHDHGERWRLHERAAVHSLSWANEIDPQKVARYVTIAER